MSVAEPVQAPGAAAGSRLALCGVDIVELCALRGRARELERLAADQGARLAAPGRTAASPAHLALCVRPERWLLLSARAAPGVVASAWEHACAGRAAVNDLSSAWNVLHLSGDAAREVLARGCRLDLDPRVFAPGQAAASLAAQVPLIIAAQLSGFLLLTPASTARHFREWLLAAGRPFGVAAAADLEFATLLGVSVP